MDAHQDDDEQQHVWKVSSKLDQMDMLCEQHQHQTEHHDGLPDWPLHPNEVAGVASKTHVDVPSNFAWAKECSGAPAAQQKLMPVHPTPTLSPAPPTSGKRHFSHAGDETSQSQRGATKRHYGSTPGDGHEAAARIEELRQETHKFLNKLAPTGSNSTSENAAKSLEEINTNVSFKSPDPPSVSSTPAFASEMIEARRTGKPGTDRHWDSQYARGRGSAQAKQATTSEPPRKPSKRFVPQPQASIFSIMETRKQTPELNAPQSQVTNPRYRTSYSDANAWIHPDATLQTATDELKARQVLDAAAGSGTNCERRYVLSATSALRVAKESAREFLGEHLHVTRVKKSGTPANAVSSSASAAKSRPTRDEANQTEFVPCARALQPPKVESSSQTDADVSPSPTAAMPVAINKIPGRARAPRKASDRSSTEAAVKPQWSATKARIVHENPKTHAVTSFISHHQSTTNPLLLYPRYPPEPMIFRAKSTYTTEFGRAVMKKRLAAR